jgi:serine/threonine-protein kinase HipA
MISLRTLCKETAGGYALRYKELMDKVRLHSCQPEIDVSRFFRQMVFNAVIGNTDDHLKNFAMIRDAEGYKLSKAFDLVPDILEKKEHTLLFNLNPHTSGVELVEIGESWDVKSPSAIVSQVCEVAHDFRKTATSLRVPPASIEMFAPAIMERATSYTQMAGKPGKAMADQIMAADKTRLKSQLGALSSADMKALEAAILLHLGMPR